MPTYGKRSGPPCFAVTSIPYFTEGMYSRGIEPPLMPSTNSRSPSGVDTGSNFTQMTAYWPRPPDWRMKRASVSSARLRRCL